MRSFFKIFFLFLLFAIVVSGGVLFRYMYANKLSLKDKPAPNLSDSYSFNEKMLFMRDHEKNVSVIAMGSSMSLNNLDSKAIMSSCLTGKYLNTASWGMSIKDDYNLLKVLGKIYTPTTIIIASNLIDFQQTNKDIRYDLLQGYLQAAHSPAYYHISLFNLKYYVDNFNFAKKARSDKSDYDYLGFDATGTVNFDSSGFKIKPERWINDYIEKKIDSAQYLYLDSIAAFCQNKKVQLLVFQSPFRDGVCSKLSSAKKDILQGHINNIQKILSMHQAIFVDTKNFNWSDEWFEDAMHFNTKGAQLFTQYCFDRLKD